MKTAPFKIYNASAGSGKTFTLVKEYLKVCITAKSAEKFMAILAITFTNKAATEMKERIIKSLKAFSNPDKAEQTELDMMEIIAEETGLAKKEIQSRSQLIFENILHNYSQFLELRYSKYFGRPERAPPANHSCFKLLFLQSERNI